MDFLIVGTGNPGKEYETTRHNIGFIVVDNFAEKVGIELSKSGHKGLYGIGNYNLSNRLILLKPATFMNKSGESVKEIKNFYKIPADQMIVIQDELDYEFGEVQVKFGGGTAGHKGIKSIIDNIGDQDFYRIRVGIGKPEYKSETNDHVLSVFTEEEFEKLEDIVNKAVEAIEETITNWEKNRQNQQTN